jgi:hypothetical protein
VRGVEVLSLVLGSVDTPARQRAGLPDMPGVSILSADEVARHALDHLTDGGPVQVPPAWAPLFQWLTTTPRRQIAELMGSAMSVSGPLQGQ